ncbi:MAG: DUF1566 domain-containing protein, partial [Bacteroidales bacterium]|nr:DUF1566 domain-containing protein [Bacteroidales bacterium]
MREKIFSIIGVVLITIPCFLSNPVIAQEIKTQLSNQSYNIGDKIKDKKGRRLYFVEKDRTRGYVFRITMGRSSILTDPNTGLQWRKKPKPPYGSKGYWKLDPECSFEDTQAWLKENNEGWRIPSYEELETFSNNRFRYHKHILTSTPSDRDPNDLKLFDLNRSHIPVSKINETSSDKPLSKGAQQLRDFNGGSSYSVTSKNIGLGPVGCVFLVRGAKQEPPETNITEKNLRIQMLPKQILPDGKSTVEITASLF